MPLQNRVSPFGDIVATTARCALMGNRGCLHDHRDHPVRQYQSRRWIICVLDFKGRTRQPMPPDHYTSLFFLDEATALAAGHRPCAECQHERFTTFRAHWGRRLSHASRQPHALGQNDRCDAAPGADQQPPPSAR